MKSKVLQPPNKPYAVWFERPVIATTCVRVDADSAEAALVAAQTDVQTKRAWWSVNPVDPRFRPLATQVDLCGADRVGPQPPLPPGQTADFEVVFYRVSTKAYTVRAHSAEHAACLAETMRLAGTSGEEGPRDDEGVWVPRTHQLIAEEEAHVTI